MQTRRRAALALTLACLTGPPALAATCSLTVQGALVIDGEACSAVEARGGTRVLVQNGDAVTIARSAMRVRFAPGRDAGGRLGAAASFGRVVTSDGADDRTCYFNQKATLCVDR